MPLSALLVLATPADGSRFRFLPILLAFVTCFATAAGAHTITVDGQTIEWGPRTGPSTGNLGQIARDPQEAGEFIWNDATGDERTDFFSPDLAGDLREVRITADATKLYFCMKLADITTTSGNGAPMVQVAIDLDRASGSGQSYFAGFCDTQVGPDARWEYLVVTRFGSGGAPAVYDQAYTIIGAGAAAIDGTTDAIEIGVPWSALGLPGPPPQALRFSVAIFRSNAADEAWEIGDATISDALDAVTNYLNPCQSPYPNTWFDVQDGVLDYAFDVWFGPTGEPFAPLAVSEVMVNPTTSGEWVEIANRTSSPLALDGFKIGDEETPDGTERMAAFPTGFTIQPGMVVTAAASASTFNAAYTLMPDFEWSATEPAVPDLFNYVPWSAGAVLGLANAGDEVLLLDRWDTVLDVLVYGSGAYAGVTPYATGPTAGYVLERTLVTHDTDDCSADFFHMASPTPGVPGDGNTGVPPAPPSSLALGPAVPNPARLGATLALALPRVARVRASVFDVGGRRVRRLADGVLPAGVQALAWDLADDGGRRLAPGAYRVLVEVDGTRLTRTVVTLR